MRHLLVATGALLGALFLTLGAMASTLEQSALELLGVRLERAEAGVVAATVQGDSPAFRAGVRKGDAILSVDGVPVNEATPEQVAARMLTPRRDPIRLRVRRAGGGQQDLTLARPDADELQALQPQKRDRPTGGRPTSRPQIPGPHSTGRPEVISQAGVVIGQPMLDLTLPRLDGSGELTLSDLVGKPIFLDFWATWCMPCRAEAPALRLIHQTFGDRVEMVGVSLDRDVRTAQQYVQSNGHGYVHLIGGLRHPTVQAYGVHRTGIPLNVLIDADGYVAGIDLHGEPLALAMEALLAAGNQAGR